MINKENLKGRTGGKTKTSTISQWSHIRWTADDNTHPVSGDEMFDRPSGIFNHGHQDNETMTNKKHQTGRTGGRTETSATIRWADDTINPVMGCKVKRFDRPKTRNRRRNKPQAQASGGRMKLYDDYVPSYAEFLHLKLKEVNQ